MQNYNNEKADAVLSLDVIYHLVEDTIFEKYMDNIFDCAQRWVVIYSSNFDGLDESLAEHVRHRKFTNWVTANRRDGIAPRSSKMIFNLTATFKPALTQIFISLRNARITDPLISYRK